MPLSTFDAGSFQARGIEHLFILTLAICAIVFIVVSLLVCYSAFRFRAGSTASQPRANFGNRKLEIVWTAIPVFVLLILFGSTWSTVRAVDPPPAPDPDVIVTGRQWWWNVEYPKAGVTTANEIHLPLGRDISVQVVTGDVIHDFQVQQLGRKVDAIPGFRNHVWIRADRPGVYLGACAEYCGQEHAWMRFRVIGEPPARFEAWQRQQAEPARTSEDQDAQAGAKRFQELTCVNCHAIRGTSADKHVGPDLTHLASRKMLAGERLTNTPENLSKWLQDPGAFKPGTTMPNLQLAQADITSLTAYLESLQ